MNEQREMVVSAYDSSWVDKYEAEAARLAETFSTSLVNLHHIGSTSVPGLYAKPTIDIAVELASTTNISDFYPAMESLGYACRGECLDAIIPGTPGRFYFVLYAGVEHLFHVHAYRTGHEDLEEKIVLRNFLLAHPEVAREYGIHKIETANTNKFDNIGYMHGKDVFIKNMLVNAHKWSSHIT